ncbi:hypothetical protein [Streptomyces olivaceiscleroticus]
MSRTSAGTGRERTTTVSKEHAEQLATVTAFLQALNHELVRER